MFTQNLVHPVYLILLFFTFALGDFTCGRYTPWGGRGNTAIPRFQGYDDQAWVQQFGITLGKPLRIDPSNPSGTLFRFQQCNSTSMLMIGQTDKNYCGEADEKPYPCDDIYSYLRVINPASGNCMTRRDAGPEQNGYRQFDVVFQKCNPNPTDQSQIFLSWQRVSHFLNHTTGGLGYTKFLSFGSDSSRWTWRLAPNNRTLIATPIGYPDAIFATAKFPS